MATARKDVADLVEAYDPSSLYLDYTPLAPLSPAVSYVDGVPVTRVAMATKPEEIAAAIRASIAKQSSGPRFVSIGLVTWGNDADDAAAALSAFGDDVVAVAPDEFAGLLAGAAADGYTGSSDVPGPLDPAPGACRADVDRIDWGSIPVPAAFLANAIFGGDLPAGAVATTTDDGVRVTVDEGALSDQVLATLRALGPLAFSGEALAGGTAQVQVTGLRAGSTNGDEVTASGSYAFEVSLDPGDGRRTLSLSVPVVCSARLVEDAPPPLEPTPPADPLPSDATFTG